MKEIRISTHTMNGYPEIRVEIKEKDYNHKVGDIVKIYDGSYNIDKKTGEERNGIDPLFMNNYCKVVEIDCNKWDNGVVEGVYVQTDLLLEFLI